jgi:hypothetical protein
MKMIMALLILGGCGGEMFSSGFEKEETGDAGGETDETTDTDRPGSRYCMDQDLDGYGSRTDCVVRVEPPAGYIEQGGDCDDTDASINPDAVEVDEDVDEDCDGFFDEGECDAPGMWCLDDDKDGFGDPALCYAEKPDPWHYVTNDNDCDDSSGSVYPGAEEDADDGRDQDCDGIVDESWESAVVCVQIREVTDVYEVFAKSPMQSSVWPVCMDATVPWPECGLEDLVTEVYGASEDADQVSELILGKAGSTDRVCATITAAYGDDVIVNALAAKGDDVHLLYADGSSAMRVWIDGEESFCAYDDSVYRCRRPYRDERMAHCVAP